MSGQNDKKAVQISPDQSVESLGKSQYFAARDGKYDSHAYRASLYIAISLVVLIFFAMYFTKDMDHAPKESAGWATPGIARQDGSINPKWLTERDLVNVIGPRRTEKSYMGKIRVVNLRGTAILPIGSEMSAVLASGATDGIVKARLTAKVVVDGETVLPERTILFGKGKSGDERLFIEFTKAILPNGDAFPIRAQAFDAADRILGLKGALVGTRTKKMAGAIGFGLIGGMAEGLQSDNGASYFMAKRPTTRDAALAGASRAALDQSKLYLDEMKNAPNIIEVKAGTQVVVITDEPKPEEKY